MKILINFDTNKKKYIFIIIESKRRILKKNSLHFILIYLKVEIKRY
jgi:hypothetical protein